MTLHAMPAYVLGMAAQELSVPAAPSESGTTHPTIRPGGAAETVDRPVGRCAGR